MTRTYCQFECPTRRSRYFSHRLKLELTGVGCIENDSSLNFDNDLVIKIETFIS